MKGKQIGLQVPESRNKRMQEIYTFIRETSTYPEMTPSIYERDSRTVL